MSRCSWDQSSMPPNCLLSYNNQEYWKGDPLMRTSGTRITIVRAFYTPRTIGPRAQQLCLLVHRKLSVGTAGPIEWFVATSAGLSCGSGGCP